MKKEETAHFCSFNVHLLSSAKFKDAKKNWMCYFESSTYLPIYPAPIFLHFCLGHHDNERHPDFLSPLFQTQPSEQHVHERLRGSCQHQSQDAEPGQRRGEAASSSPSAWNACCMSPCRHSERSGYCHKLLLSCLDAKQEVISKAIVAKIALWNDSEKSGCVLHTEKPQYVHWHLASEMHHSEGREKHLAGCSGLTPAVRNGDCGSGYFCSCDGGCMESPTLCSCGAIIAPEETPASHPHPSCVPAPAPVCRRLSVSTTSCDVPALILAGGARKLTGYCFYASVGLVDTRYDWAGFASFLVKANSDHQWP